MAAPMSAQSAAFAHMCQPITSFTSSRLWRNARLQTVGVNTLLQASAPLAAIALALRPPATNRPRDTICQVASGLSSYTYDDDTQYQIDFLQAQIDELSPICDRLRGSTAAEQVSILEALPIVQEVLRDHCAVAQHIEGQPEDLKAALLSVIACGQHQVLTVLPEGDWRGQMTALATELCKVMQFYDSLGGIVGYQAKCLELICAAHAEDLAGSDAGAAAPGGEDGPQFLVPEGPNFQGPEGRAAAHRAAADGLRGLPQLAEVYPLGGAGDRLGLICEETGQPLPAAMLPYCGRPMLEGLMRDLQAREYLYYKLYGEQHTTPVAIMTSDAKGNHERVSAFLDAVGFYGRPRDSFRLFCQPLVPVLEAHSGQWVLPDAMRPSFKPGGHGAIWKLMYDKGIFKWLADNGRMAALIRQISNPMASTDCTLLALAGTGHRDSRAFGFASCDRVVGAAEGMNVLVERQVQNTDATGNGADAQYEYGITNVEYTEFERLGIEDKAISEDSNQSCFPANTNILYVGLRQAEAAVHRGMQAGGGAALPGMIFNLKKRITYTSAVSGEERSVQAGRMECTMQNLADELLQRFPSRLRPGQASGLDTFVVYNERRYVTSSAKRKAVPGNLHIHQTPDGSFLDLMRNARDMLEMGGVRVPDPGSVQQYLARGPAFIFLFNPALGPVWQVVAGKVQGGAVSEGSEVVLEVAELCWRDVTVAGSLLVHAEQIVGHCEAGPERRLRFSDECGRVRLHNVTVRNAGVDFADAGNRFWSHRVCRREACRVTLRGCSEFEARDVELPGDLHFEVPDGFRMYVCSDAAAQSGFRTELLPLQQHQPTWRWQYSMQDDGAVRLDLTELGVPSAALS